MSMNYALVLWLSKSYESNRSIITDRSLCLTPTESGHTHTTFKEQTML